MIRASELGEHAYCARAWWLRLVRGTPSANTAALARGEVSHSAHGRRVLLAVVLRVVSAGLMVAALIGVIISTLI
jgi:hypothetical protein